MVRHQRSGQAQATGFCQAGAQAPEEVGTIDIGPKFGPAFNAANHDVVEMAGKIRPSPKSHITQEPFSTLQIDGTREIESGLARNKK